MTRILLVNQWNPLPEDFDPGELVDLWKMQPRHFFLTPWPQLLVPDAAYAANELFALADQDGLFDFVVRSSYRDRARQTMLYENQKRLGMVAAPGTSEHETGLAMDVGTATGGFVREGRHALWMAEHCWDFGFILRYPPGKEQVTGIPSEPWHFRYVGKDAAREMRDRGVVLEEYLQEESAYGARCRP